MQLDSVLKSDRCTLVFEAIGDDKVRVTCRSWDDSRVILAEEALHARRTALHVPLQIRTAIVIRCASAF